jgi:hypothetical protein
MSDFRKKFWDLVKDNNDSVLSETRKLLESTSDNKEREAIVNWKNPDEVKITIIVYYQCRDKCDFKYVWL